MADEFGVAGDIQLEGGINGYEAFKKGLYYANGDNEDADDEKAKYYFELAAQYHVANACGMLGVMYENGRIGAPDLNKALPWYELAYRYGNEDALSDVNRVKEAVNKPAFKTKSFNFS